MWQVFLMYALFGSIFSVGKIAVEASQPYFLTGTRMLLAGALIIGYLYVKNPEALRIPKRCWPILLGVAIFNVFITNAFEFWGLQFMPAGKTSLIYSLSPFAAAFIGYFSGSELMTGRKWAGLCLGIASFFPLMAAPWFEDGAHTAPQMELLAECALLISAVTAVIGWILVKKLTVEQGISHPAVNGFSFILAGVMCMFTSAAIETWNPVPVALWTDFLWTLLYIVIVHNIICYSIYASSLRRFSVTFMAFAGLSNPLFAGITGWAFLHEEMTPAFWLAMVGVSAGLFLYYREETKAAEAV